MSPELLYIGLVFALFVVPKALQRFRIPAAVTSLALGVAAARAGLFDADPVVALLSTLGITGLFLFAGLEVDLADLRRGAAVVAQHVAIQATLVAGAASLLCRALDLAWRPAALVSLALLTPSTGFILDSLPTFGLDERQAFWTRSKAVATELVALCVLFVVVQSSSPLRLVASSAALLALVLVIPAALRLFASAIAPYAPRSEFAFLVMLGVVAAYATRHLGVYYLVGAFLVGIAARRFRRLPAFSSDRLVGAVEVFASFFAPFYFFGAGAHLDPAVLGVASLLVGLGLFVALVPVRIASVAAHRRVALGEPWAKGVRVGVSLVPTLVFSLVLAELARRFEAPAYLVGGIVVYAVANTMLPALALGVLPAFDAPHAEQASPPAEEATPPETQVVAIFPAGPGDGPGG
jgi:Kef-type K+ transport system membrane component KefB